MRLAVSVSDRHAVSSLRSTVVLVVSLVAGILAVSIVFVLSGVNPLFALYKIFAGSFGSFYGLKETITKAIPLILLGTSLVLAFKGKFWNIGAEGQLLMGATFATWVALNWGSRLPAYVTVPLIFAAGFVGGAAFGFIPAFLKVRFGINEVISTLMLNYIAAEIVQMLVVGPWKGETQFGFPYTDEFPESAQLFLLPGSRIHIASLILGIIIILVLFMIIYRTRFGYEVRVIGENTEAARYAGIDFFRTTIILMIISGGIAGLAGTGEVAGIHHHLSYPYTISAGYGFTAIIVAWLAKLNPVFVLASGIFFAGILVGGDAIQLSLNLPAATVEVFNGVILFFLIMGDFFLKNKVSLAYSFR